MANPIVISGSSLGTQLTDLLQAEDIQPGSTASYQLCKTIFVFHPLGAKMAETPVKMAQALGREISVGAGPEDDLREAFKEQWDRDLATQTIRSVATLARVYGVASLALVEKDVDPGSPLKPGDLAEAEIAFNTLDPLNTAGSLVLMQDPNSIEFQKHKDIAVNGKRYHRSRTVTMMNEQPVYIEYTNSAFGFTGRSVYQRALFPLKAFVDTMRTDALVARKAGLIIAKFKAPGSIMDSVMAAAAGFKRNILKQAGTENVVNISEGEDIISLDLTNIDGAMVTARKNILLNIATAADMPARILNHETFAEGFGEGSEDAKAESAYIDGVREWLRPLYEFMDQVVQRRAWNPRFFASLQDKYEHLKKRRYADCFYEWQRAFKAEWPSLLRESESEMVQIDDTKMKALIAMVQVFDPSLDAANKVNLLKWVEDQVNSTPRLFSVPLQLDYDGLLDKLETDAASAPQRTGADGDEGDAAGIKPPPAPELFSARDSVLSAYVGSPGTQARIVRIEEKVKGRGYGQN